MALRHFGGRRARQAPHYTEIAARFGEPVEEGRRRLRALMAVRVGTVPVFVARLLEVSDNCLFWACAHDGA